MGNLRNVINDRRCHRTRTLTPPRHSLERATTLVGRGGFRALASSLRQVVWPNKFKPGSIDKYDDFSNLEEFIQVYHTIVEVAGGDDRVKANYLLMTLSGAARS
jgi:hypothetical protein